MQKKRNSLIEHAHRKRELGKRDHFPGGGGGYLGQVLLGMCR